MTDNQTAESLLREFVADACECEVRDYLISEHAERIEKAIAATLWSEREKALEELVQDWQVLYEEPDYGDCVRLRKRMQELGIEVIDE